MIDNLVTYSNGHQIAVMWETPDAKWHVWVPFDATTIDPAVAKTIYRKPRGAAVSHRDATAKANATMIKELAAAVEAMDALANARSDFARREREHAERQRELARENRIRERALEMHALLQEVAVGDPVPTAEIKALLDAIEEGPTT